MPPKSNAKKRRAESPEAPEPAASRPTGSKTKRAGLSEDAPTSIRNTHPVQVEEEPLSGDAGDAPSHTGRPIRENRGKGGHAAQLERALEPLISRSGLLKELSTKNPDTIPEDEPENTMAPLVKPPRRGQLKAYIAGKSGQSSAKSHSQLIRKPLPQAAPVPVFQKGTAEARFGFIPGPKENSEPPPSQQRPSNKSSHQKGMKGHPKGLDDIDEETEYDHNQGGGEEDSDSEDSNNSEDSSDSEDDNKDSGEKRGEEDEDDDNGQPDDIYTDNDEDHHNRQRKERDQDSMEIDPNSIDQQSPSEDEALAQEALRTYRAESPEIDHYVESQRPGVDVLEDHRKRNRAVRPPKVADLINAAEFQRRQANPGDSDSEEGDSQAEDDGTNSNSEGDEDDEDIPVKSKRAVRHSKVQPGSQPKPTVLKHYVSSSGWTVVINNSKKEWRRSVAIENGFPTIEQDLKKVAIIVANQIREYQRSGYTLETDFQNNRNIHILVFNEHSTFRQNLKQVARSAVLLHYADVILPDIGEDQGGGYGQAEQENLVQDSVKKALSGSFHISPILDANRKSQNMGHPGIQDAILQFFYTGKDCLASIFPKDFKRTVPDHAVALVATAIYHCLQEYEEGSYKSFNFQGDKYRPILENHKDTIRHLRKHAYHGKQYEQRVAEWAKQGMKNLNKGKEPKSTYKATLVLD